MNWCRPVAARQEPRTIRAYSEDVAAFRAFTGKGLRATYRICSATRTP
jgi:hypothetical protein